MATRTKATNKREHPAKLARRIAAQVVSANELLDSIDVANDETADHKATTSLIEGAGLILQGIQQQLERLADGGGNGQSNDLRIGVEAAPKATPEPDANGACFMSPSALRELAADVRACREQSKMDGPDRFTAAIIFDPCGADGPADALSGTTIFFRVLETDCVRFTKRLHGLIEDALAADADRSTSPVAAEPASRDDVKFDLPPQARRELRELLREQRRGQEAGPDRVVVTVGHNPDESERFPEHTAVTLYSKIMDADAFETVRRVNDLIEREAERCAEPAEVVA